MRAKWGSASMIGLLSLINVACGDSIKRDTVEIELSDKPIQVCVIFPNNNDPASFTKVAIYSGGVMSYPVRRMDHSPNAEDYYPQVQFTDAIMRTDEADPQYEVLDEEGWQKERIGEFLDPLTPILTTGINGCATLTSQKPGLFRLYYANVFADYPMDEKQNRKEVYCLQKREGDGQILKLSPKVGFYSLSIREEAKECMLYIRDSYYDTVPRDPHGELGQMARYGHYNYKLDLRGGKRGDYRIPAPYLAENEGENIASREIRAEFLWEGVVSFEDDFNLYDNKKDNIIMFYNEWKKSDLWINRKEIKKKEEMRKKWSY